MGCTMCVEACPVKETLDWRISRAKSPVPNWVFGVLVAGGFAGVVGLAMLTGHWQNGISKDEYLHRFKNIESPIYQHFQGQVPEYGPND